MPIINKENLNSTCKKIAYASAEMTIMMAQRTYYFDKQIINNLEVTKQIVFLGTGYDTRPKRFEKQFENLKVFEVTQTKKRQVTDKLNWPSNVQFVEIDFNNDSLKKDLESKGYNPKLKTIFILDLYLYYRCYLLYSKRIFISNSLFIKVKFLNFCTICSFPINGPSTGFRRLGMQAIFEKIVEMEVYYCLML